MSTLSFAQLVIALLCVSVLIMAGINLYALLKLLPMIDSEDKGIADARALARRILDRLTELGDLISSPPTKAAVTSDDAWLDELESPLQAISRDTIDGLEHVLSSSESLLQGMSEGMSDDEFLVWRKANELQVRSLMASFEHQRRNLSKLQAELDMARGTILALRSGGARAALGSMQAVGLTAKNAALELENGTLRAERTRIGTALEIAERELQSTTGATPIPLTQDTGQLEARIAELEAGNAALQALHDRTLLEKKFVEDSFVLMDQQLHIGQSLEVAKG